MGPEDRPDPDSGATRGAIDGAIHDDGRLPYEPPAIVSEEVFETLALGCSKTSSQGTCLPPNTANS